MAVLWLNNHDILIKTNLLSESQAANTINAGVRSRRPPRHKLSMQMSDERIGMRNNPKRTSVPFQKRSQELEHSRPDTTKVQLNTSQRLQFFPVSLPFCFSSFFLLLMFSFPMTLMKSFKCRALTVSLCLFDPLQGLFTQSWNATH